MDKDIRDIEWYKLDTDAFVAVIQSGGPPGLFLLATGAKAWVWYSHGTDGWDSVHQRIYRQHHATAKKGPPARAPALPKSVVVAPPPNLDDPGALRMNATLIDWIAAGPSNRRTAYAVLSEDGYETLFGDGLFRDLEACFPSRKAAAAYDVSPGMKRHLRRLKLRVTRKKVVAIGERRDFADKYNMESALADLAARLKTG